MGLLRSKIVAQIFQRFEKHDKDSEKTVEHCKLFSVLSNVKYTGFFSKLHLKWFTSKKRNSRNFNYLVLFSLLAYTSLK